MEPIVVVALVCSSALAASDCTRDTALDVVTAPAHSLQEYLIQGPTIAASSGRASDADTYVKTRCERRR